MSEVRDVVRALLTKRAPLPGDEGFNYIDTGHVDSLGVMALVVALEERFDIEIADGDIVSDAFRTVDGLIAIVDRVVAEKRSEAA